jgi:hypothetical protein
MPTHFIFKLLQIAEDDLARRGDCQVPRSVSFHLTKATLQVNLSGQPFREVDIRRMGYENIATELRRINTSTLLFLRQIEEINWRIDEGGQ